MKLTHIEIISGLEKQKEIEGFYHKEGSQIFIDYTDLLFIAMSGKEILGCLIFSMEDQIPLLKSMRVAKDSQRQKIALELLRRFAIHLNDGDIMNTYCFSPISLENFFAQLGFTKISDSEIPVLLQKRKAADLICMRRD